MHVVYHVIFRWMGFDAHELVFMIGEWFCLDLKRYLRHPITSTKPHELHCCELIRTCPVKCKFNSCRRSCAEPDHFHALNKDAVHLCGYEVCRILVPIHLTFDIGKNMLALNYASNLEFARSRTLRKSSSPPSSGGSVDTNTPR